MIYLDTSVLLAELLAEDRRPPAGLWLEALIASRLIICETRTRRHARGLAPSHGARADALLAQSSSSGHSSPSQGRSARSMPCIWRRSSSCSVIG